jgi:hypothetical protein
LHSADHALVEIAEGFAAQGWRPALDSVDLDVGAAADVFVEHLDLFCGLIRINKKNLDLDAKSLDWLELGSRTPVRLALNLWV